ncbi:probable F-box protein At4g23960 [Salvia hispanica]|uniref:probable F-box protein At4g23960 n=1 Tax=Salvia hispanica TaxID=49212 RepID=UPI002009324E|nr:probable F-box protein At4g23960 [Salvia hispanica]
MLLIHRIRKQHSDEKQRNLSELGDLRPSVGVDGQNGVHSPERTTVLFDGDENGAQTGLSLVEQLMPDLRLHALSFLDYPSVCRLSMANSLLYRAANDEILWKTLYLKDFSLEQADVTPANGWKAYYAANLAIVNINAEFFRIVKERSHTAMSQFWLKAGYVKCFRATGESFTGYNQVMESWRATFNQENDNNFQIRDVVYGAPSLLSSSLPRRS